MVGEFNDSFLLQHGRLFCRQTIKKNNVAPFKDHSQFTVLIDILSRKDTHHAIVCSNNSHKVNCAFLEGFYQHLLQEQIPPSLQGAELLHLDIANLICSEAQRQVIEKDFQLLHTMLDNNDKYLLIALTNDDLLKNNKIDENILLKQLAALLPHPRCRFLVFSNSHECLNYLSHFALLHIPEPNENDLFAILKQHRLELENFHQVTIPDEILSTAYNLAERYLSTYDTLEKAIQLLDSSAARTNLLIHQETDEIKPVVTLHVLSAVLSGWTQIPSTHLYPNRFKISEFTQGMQQRIFGQDAAISLLVRELQQAQAHLQQHTGPFCSLLFAGPEHAGKRTTALALAEQLFKQLNVLHSVQPMALKAHALLDSKFQRCVDKYYLPLKEIIRQTPHAIIMFENIDQIASKAIDQLHEILTTGLLYDENGYIYNFRQAIIIMTTTVGSKSLQQLSQSLLPEEETQNVGLMQLVMNELRNESIHHDHSYSPQEIVDEILPEISSALPSVLQQCAPIIPFLPLNKNAIEKIIRLKLKLLGKMLDTRHGIELGYAPEVIRYLTNEVIQKESANSGIDIDKTLKQLYFAIEQAILSQADNKNRPNQLFLQLNETGQLLRCDWLVMSSSMRQHAL